jgi:hypothetical protein
VITDELLSYDGLDNEYVPVIGDWTHSGQTRIGVFRQSQWWLDMNGDHVWDGVHDTFVLFGISSDKPVVAK